MPPRVSSLPCEPLLRRSVDLLWLYRRAAAVCEPGLRVVLDENAQTLAALIADLRTLAPAPESRWKHAPALWRRQLRRRAVVSVMHATGNRERAWIALLGRREAALLGAFEHAAHSAPSATARMLGHQLPRLHALYLDMHSLVGTAGG